MTEAPPSGCAPPLCSVLYEGQGSACPPVLGVMGQQGVGTAAGPLPRLGQPILAQLKKGG